MSEEYWGYFSENPKMELLIDGREMRLLEEFSYIDRAGKLWLVPKGHVVNGANIPQAVWNVFGGPWDGLHRNASILHDYYCATKKDTWINTQMMFFEACRCAGMSAWKASVFYFFVKCCAKWD